MIQSLHIIMIVWCSQCGIVYSVDKLIEFGEIKSRDCIADTAVFGDIKKQERLFTSTAPTLP